MKFVFILYAFFMLCVIAACTAVKVAPIISPPAPAPITAPTGNNFKGWKYDSFVQAHLTPTMLMGEPKELCPQYGITMNDEKKFWGALVSSISYAESGYNPNDTYTENFKDALTGTLAISAGLMQLSVGDKLGYKTPYCTTLNATNIFDPETNLGCALEIMNQLVSHDNIIGDALGKYWSTIRVGHEARANLKIDIPECYQ